MQKCFFFFYGFLEENEEVIKEQEYNDVHKPKIKIYPNVYEDFLLASEQNDYVKNKDFISKIYILFSSAINVSLLVDH